MAACAPLALFPPFKTTIGLELLRHKPTKRRPSTIDSRYRPITFVCASCSMYSIRSHSSTSILFPTEHTLLMPVMRLLTISIRKPPESIPLCTMSETWPGIRPSLIASGAIKEKTWPFTPSTSPMQFGPHRRMPVFCLISRSLFCSSTPSAPISAKPADSIMTPGIFLAAQSDTARGTSLAGTKMIAASTLPGISCVEG